MIDFAGATKCFGGQRAVGPLSLFIPKGQFVAVLGGSGSGKTTALKMINGLVRPDSGSVSVGGHLVGSGCLSELRRKIGYVFQDIGLFPHMTVAENIAIGPRLARWSPDRIAERVRELLQLVALPSDIGRRMPSALSGGQRQRVGVARGLAAGPDVMLMDEPFGALDPITRDALGSEYRSLHNSLGLTTIMVTHDVTEALRLAERVVVLDRGTICADSTPRELLGGHASLVVQALIETSRRQARQIAALAASDARDE